MTLDAVTGEIFWMPTVTDGGVHHVQILAIDAVAQA